MTPREADLVGPEPVTGEPGPVGGFLALLDPLLRGPALIVETDDGAVGPAERGDDKAHPRKEFPEMMLDLGDQASRPAPGRRVILEAAVADQRGMARSAAGPRRGSEVCQFCANTMMFHMAPVAKRASTALHPKY
jgi:hypothetical protein